jgi:hypothetical protein
MQFDGVILMCYAVCEKDENHIRKTVMNSLTIDKIYNSEKWKV